MERKVKDGQVMAGGCGGRFAKHEHYEHVRQQLTIGESFGALDKRGQLIHY